MVPSYEGPSTPPTSPKEKKWRKEQVLTKGVPSVAQSIANAVVIKDGNVFFLTPPGGEVPMTVGHGFGLYYHDCRYLNGYEITVGDAHPESLASRASEGGRAVFLLTTPDFPTPDGRRIHRETVGLKWERVIDAEQCLLHERLDIQKFSSEPVEFPITLRYRTGFEDVFEIRGLIREVKGKLFRPKWKDKCLRFAYEGADEVFRSLTVYFEPHPDEAQGNAVRYSVKLQPNEIKQVMSVHSLR